MFSILLSSWVFKNTQSTSYCTLRSARENYLVKCFYFINVNELKELITMRALPETIDFQHKHTVNLFLQP